jgi:hypothetical protein
MPCATPILSAGARFGLARSTAFSGSCSAQSEAGSLRAILDFDSGFHFERSESRHPRPGRCRTAAFLGKPAARTGRLDFVPRRTVAAGAVAAADRCDDVVSNAFIERGSDRMNTNTNRPPHAFLRLLSQFSRCASPVSPSPKAAANCASACAPSRRLSIRRWSMTMLPFRSAI